MTSWCHLITAALIAVTAFIVGQVFAGYGIWFVLTTVFLWIGYSRRQHRIAKTRRDSISSQSR